MQTLNSPGNVSIFLQNPPDHSLSYQSYFNGAPRMSRTLSPLGQAGVDYCKMNGDGPRLVGLAKALIFNEHLLS